MSLKRKQLRGRFLCFVAFATVVGAQTPCKRQAKGVCAPRNTGTNEKLMRSYINTARSHYEAHQSA